LDAFCRYTILQDELLEVPDTRADSRFATSNYVTAEPGIRFYAGAPLVDAEGFRLGSLCVVDSIPRKLTPEQLDALSILSSEVISHLTLRKQKAELEATVQRQQEFYNLFNSSPDIHGIINAGGVVEIINDSFSKILGYPAAEVLGQTIWSFFAGGDAGKCVSEFKTKLAGRTTFEIQTKANCKDGGTRWINWCVSNKNDKWYISGRDNTQQKKVRAELEQLSLVASKVSNGVAIMDAHNQTVWINSAFTKITGFELDEVAGKQLSEVLRGDYADKKVLKKGNDLIKTKKPFEIDLRINTKDGRLLWVSIINSVILDNKGEIDKHIKIIIDITDRKSAEHDLNIFIVRGT
jgi:PAS domain S-box-containing protein